jgi:hypothetical protein
VQTVYVIDVLGTHLEAVEIGTSPRYGEGEAVPVHLPLERCMAFRRPDIDAADLN